MRTTVLTESLSIEPGQPASFQVEVLNTLDIVDLITVSVPGLRADEVAYDRESVSLFPDERAIVTVTLKLPRAFPAGPNLIPVQVRSAMRPERVDHGSVEVLVAPEAAARMLVLPRNLVGRRTIRFGATIINEGNTPLRADLVARDEERRLRISILPGSVVVPAGGEETVSIEARSRPPIIGSPRYQSVYVAADTDAGLLSETVPLTQKALVTQGIVTAFILAAIIALWATIVTFGVGFVLRDEAVPKALPGDFAQPASIADLVALGTTGAQSGPDADAVAAILGSASGRVVGAVDGSPVPRVTVEAHRIPPQRPVGAGTGDAPAPSSDPLAATRVLSAGTGDDGTYSLPGLFPDDYYLRLTGDGFVDCWYPLPISASLGEQACTGGTAGGTPQTVGVAEEVAVPDIALGGEPGTITGSVDTGDRVVPVDILARVLIDGVPTGDATATTAQAADADGDGRADGPASYALPALASPSAYRIQFLSQEFADQVIEEDLGPGEQLAAKPVRLVPGDGTVEGTIILQGPVPDDALSITATSGDTTFTTEAVPPTSTGPDTAETTYRFAGLPTPGTYAIEVTAAGYDPARTSVDLSAGEQEFIPAVVLQAATRSLRGRVVDDATGIPLGEVAVSVLGPTAQVATTTLPGPDTLAERAPGQCPAPVPAALTAPAPGAGTFQLDALEDGALAITFSREGYRSQTHRVDVDGIAGPVVLDPSILVDGRIVIRLQPTVGEICGTVSGVDTDGTAPVPAGAVLLRGGPAGTPSASDDGLSVLLSSQPAGTYVISEVPAGGYTLTFTSPGFEDCTANVAVAQGAASGRLLRLDVTLVRSGSGGTCTASASGT